MSLSQLRFRFAQLDILARYVLYVVVGKPDFQLSPEICLDIPTLTCWCKRVLCALSPHRHLNRPSMNLPTSIEDPSLLQHEPLCSHITMYEESFGARSGSKKVISSFIRAMQEDVQVRTRLN